VLNPEQTAWKELPPIEDSHFVFSFLATRGGVFYVGSEKGRVYRSQDFGETWKQMVEFPTNIGAYAVHEDALGSVWLGKDFVAPHHYSLWRLA
jgi:uncharacterized protein YigE (DUF2233 family)